MSYIHLSFLVHDVLDVFNFESSSDFVNYLDLLMDEPKADDERINVFDFVVKLVW